MPRTDHDRAAHRTAATAMTAKAATGPWSCAGSRDSARASTSPTSPAVARLPLVSGTSGTLPSRHMAVGSRPRKETTGSSGPVRAMTSR
ncbi:hypothetical protein AB0M57_10075 [Streptomyces sp. NPDC051597]|uniref:hypothetical protein n=1 Tax=Streptomyces sp. NPDC051597 TaxID=3155049 RepID=UPI0034287DF3